MDKFIITQRKSIVNMRNIIEIAQSHLDTKQLFAFYAEPNLNIPNQITVGIFENDEQANEELEKIITWLIYGNTESVYRVGD